MHHSYSSVYFRFFEENIALIVFNKFKNVHHHKFEFEKENNTKQPNKQLKKIWVVVWKPHHIDSSFPLCGCLFRAQCEWASVCIWARNKKVHAWRFNFVSKFVEFALTVMHLVHLQWFCAKLFLFAYHVHVYECVCVCYGCRNFFLSKSKW